MCLKKCLTGNFIPLPPAPSPRGDGEQEKPVSSPSPRGDGEQEKPVSSPSPRGDGE